MKFTKEVEQRILSAFVETLPERKLICPLCRHENWILTNGFLVMLITEEVPFHVDEAHKAILTVALSCTTCGNTHFINVLNLKGLDDIIDKSRIIQDDIKVRF
jgi:hypothetical protein